MSSYCALAPGHPWHGTYHDNEYGLPVSSDRELFERLVLEINQAGLSWLTILKRRRGFTAAFDAWCVERIAAYGEADIARLLADQSIIRNRRKIEATIHNARVMQCICGSHGSFAAWLAAHHPRSRPEWVALFRSTFRFMGEEIVGSFLMSIGYIPGAHDADCQRFAEILRLAPPWLLAIRSGFSGYGVVPNCSRILEP